MLSHYPSRTSKGAEGVPHIGRFQVGRAGSDRWDRFCCWAEGVEVGALVETLGDLILPSSSPKLDSSAQA